MSRSLLLLPLLLLAPAGFSAAPAPIAPLEPEKPPAGYHQVRLNGHTFTLPDGFTIEIAARPPIVERPIVAALDEKGRLYVCDSSGSNEKVAEQVVKKPHRILRLESSKGDGVYDKSSVFVPNVTFPEGAMWLDGALYVAAPPKILKFTAPEGDGPAIKEETWFDGKTLTGCANDLHGPYLGPDGWVYWCKGAFARQEYTLPNGNKFSTRASHIFRARPDGSGLEPVMTGGMDNPVDVVFTPGGERIFSTTFFQHPGNGKRDGLIHAVYGGVYGKDHDPVYEHPWTSPQLMPALTHMGPAAPCGLHRYESDQFGPDYADSIFCTQFNMRKVSRHVLTPDGATFVAKDSNFVVSDNLDFHPTDVIEDADGSLLILDTGGWYKLCCPTSQLVKPDVTGAIYRVKKFGAHEVADARGAKINWAKASNEELLTLLGDVRPAVRSRATKSLTSRGESGVATLAPVALSAHSSIRQRLGAVWALARIDGEAARRAVRRFLDDTADAVRNAAIHVVALHRDRDAMAETAKLLKHASPHTRRVAAEALGRMGDAKAVPAILEALADLKNDRALDHSLTYALIEIAAPAPTAAGLRAEAPAVRRAALAALHGMPNDNLASSAVFAELNSTTPTLRETAWWIAGRRPEWGDQLAEYFRDRLKRIEKMTPPEQDDLTGQFTFFLKSTSVSREVGAALARTLDVSATRSILHGLARSGVKSFPPEWKDGVLLALTTGNFDTVRDAIAVLRIVPPSGVDAAEFIVKAPAQRKRVSAQWPKDLDYALRATAPIGTRLPPDEAEAVIKDVNRDQTGLVRVAAADLLTRAALGSESLILLAGALKTANTAEISRLLPAFTRSVDDKVGLALVGALEDPAVLRVIRVEQVKPIFDKYPKAVRDEAEKLYVQLAESRKGEMAKLEQLAKSLPAGDLRRGQRVFNSAKAQCVSCHKIGYVGGLVGPDLTRVGGIRSERDLLEAIVLPSASFVRSYEPMKVLTADGRTLNGILKKDAPDEIILVVAADKEERILRADIDEISPSSVSIMPAGFDQQLSVQEIADLVAFLKACR
jgi:putative membrane-bound dehydrogenase-like protein